MLHLRAPQFAPWFACFGLLVAILGLHGTVVWYTSSRYSSKLVTSQSAFNLSSADAVNARAPIAVAAAAPSPTDPRLLRPELDNQLHHIGSPGNACTSQGGRGLWLNTSSSQLVAPVVVVAHKRVGYLAKAMVSILRHWSADPSNRHKFPLFISIDGDDHWTVLWALGLAQEMGVQVISNRQERISKLPRKLVQYQYLAKHYQMLLQLFFECLSVPRLVLIEEDLEVAPDFFSYMEAMAPLMDQDSNLWCISAWNDHGQVGRAANATQLYRTDFMPGLGWMLPARVGLELAPKWQTFWDDWMRSPEVRKGRQCIYPEVSRSHTFGAVGASVGVYYRKHLAYMLLNDQSMDWRKMDTSYLREPQYKTLLTSWLKQLCLKRTATS